MGPFDPSLVYDLSDYGNLGYDSALGPPDPNGPVQDQYTGTWAVWEAPNNDPRVGKLLAQYVLNAAINPMVYLTNGEVEGIEEADTVTFEAHVTGDSVPAYNYEWFIKEEGDASWSPVGGNNSTWTWHPVSGDAGTYAVRCMVTDSQDHSGEVVWEDFAIASGNGGGAAPIPPSASGV